AFLEKFDFKKMLKMFLWCIIGYIFFEGIHMAILCKIGIAQWRYYNLLSVITAHAGGSIKILQHFEPAGIKIFPKFIVMLAEYYIIPFGFIPISVRFILRKNIFNIMIILFLLILLIYKIHFRLKKKVSIITWMIFLYLIIYLLMSLPFYFYLKRAISLFPLVMIFIVIIFRMAVDIIPESFFHKCRLCISIFVILILFIYLSTQICLTFYAFSLRTNGVEKNSLYLERDLPESTVIYMHCYCFRFLWQVRNHRLISGDDQHMDNKMIVEWAIENKAKYVILSDRGGDVNTCKTLRYIKKYNTFQTESDCNECFKLYELIYK
ncbi:MAG: hypothetical protein ABRQ39_25400, partial [Candidatus Eremiobacterota bacterium]